jgi:hypothetical protein
MKKMYLGLVGLGCGALLLTGCGGSAHTLKCTQKYGDNEMTLTIYYNSDETKAESITGETIVDETKKTEEEFESHRDAIEDQCKNIDVKSCKVTTSGKKIILTVEANPEYFGYNGESLKEAKESFAKEDFKCE